MIKVGDRVRNIRIEAYKDEPIVVIDKSIQTALKNRRNRYHIKYLNVELSCCGDNMMSWVDESDIVLDIEYYREQKINKILE